MKPILSVLFFILVFSTSGYSQKNKTFKWADDCCEYEGSYDPSKVTEAQLKNTFNLFFWGYTLETRQCAFELKNVGKLNIDSLTNEYARKTLQVSNLKILEGEYWENLRKDVIKQLNQEFYAKKITLLAHADPSILLTYSGRDSCLIKYGNAIAAGGDLILEAWRELLEDQCSRNADPGRLRREFDEQYNSSDKYKYALVELLTFGWWNCINHSIEYTYLKYTDAYPKFKDEFTHIKELGCGCD